MGVRHPGGEYCTHAMSRRPAPPRSRRNRLQHRALPAVALALFAFIAGAVVGAGHVSGEQKTVEAFAKAWQKGDYAVMRTKLTADRQRQLDAGALSASYKDAAETATASSFTIGKAHKTADHEYSIPVVAHTQSFGDVR